MSFPIPPLNLNSNASSGMDNRGSTLGLGFGDWTVNIAGSGTAVQSASSSPNWWLIAATAWAAWYLLKK